VQEWDAETGLAAVATLQRCFGELESSQPSKETEDIYKRLLVLVGALRACTALDHPQRVVEAVWPDHACCHQY
jgi:hypothetical protein